jgi:hypothetical protein
VPAGIFLLQGRTNRPFLTRFGSLARVDPANRVEPDLVAAVIGRIFPDPAAKAGLPFFIAFGLRFSIDVFAARLIASSAAHARSNGAAAAVIAGRRRPLPDYGSNHPSSLPAAAFIR